MYMKNKLFWINFFVWIKLWMGEVLCGIFFFYYMKKVFICMFFGILCMVNNVELGLFLVLYFGMNVYFSLLILKKVGRENVICYENFY